MSDPEGPVKVFIVVRGVQIAGAYSSEGTMREQLDPDVELIPCPNPSKGWNSKDLHYRVRVVDLDMPFPPSRHSVVKDPEAPDA